MVGRLLLRILGGAVLFCLRWTLIFTTATTTIVVINNSLRRGPGETFRTNAFFPYKLDSVLT